MDVLLGRFRGVRSKLPQVGGLLVIKFDQDHWTVHAVITRAIRLRAASRLMVDDLARLLIGVLPGCQQSIRSYVDFSELPFWTTSKRCRIAQLSFEHQLRRSWRAPPNRCG